MLIQTLLHEKDEARQTYAAEILKAEALRTSLEASQAGQLPANNALEAVRAQLMVADTVSIFD